MINKKGFLVTFEGGDGVGKTTQFQLFCAWLEERGIPYVRAREPGGTPTSEEIREILKSPNFTGKSVLSELLLFEAARADNVDKVIKPALAQGKVVALDRFYDSTFAYQGYGRQMDIDIVKKLNNIAAQGVEPDLTFYFKMEPEAAFARKGGADKTEAMELAGLDFHRRVVQGFDLLAKQNPKRYVTLDSTQSIEEISSRVKEVFQQRFMPGAAKKPGV